MEFASKKKKKRNMWASLDKISFNRLTATVLVLEWIPVAKYYW